MTLHRIEVPAHVSPTGSPTVGFIEPSGKVVVEPRLFQASNFWEGRAAVNPPSKGWGIIDEAGNYVLPAAGYADIGVFSEGLCAVHDREKGWGFVDRDGQTVIAPRILNKWGMSAFPYFSEGLCAVPNDDGTRWGYIDKTGALVIPHEFAMARSFHEGFAVVEDAKGRPSYIDRTGKQTLKGEWKAAWRFDHGVAAAGATRAWGLIDRSGAWVHEPEFVFDEPHAPHSGRFEPLEWLARPLAFYDERAVFRTDKKKWGYLAPNGEIAIAAAYEKAGHFSDGLAPVLKRVKGQSRWGLIDARGRLAIDHIIEHMFPHNAFRDGLVPAAVRDGYGYKWGYVDREGKVAIPQTFDAASNFSDGIAPVRMGDVNAYIDARGNVVWRSAP